MTAAGANDTDQSNLAAMRRTAAWLPEQGATVDLAIEDPNAGHGKWVL